MKSLKSKGVERSNDQVSFDEIQYLSSKEKELFETSVRPLLKNSPYYQIRIPKQN
jgi:hypothetical protein